MKATVNPVDQHVVTLTIEVPAAEVDKGIKDVYKRQALWRCLNICDIVWNQALISLMKLVCSLDIH